MDISHPRRVLAVGRPESGLLDLLKGLTGRAPTLSGDSIAGTTHDWAIKTTYYTATVPIWLDEITEPQAWSKDFLAPEAREVLSVLGAFIVCFRKPVNNSELTLVKILLENVAEVVKEGCGCSWDGVCLAAAMPQSSTPFLEKSFEEWEEICQEFGFEFVDFESKGRNDYSEPMGIERLREALESNDWEGADNLDGRMESGDSGDLDAGGSEDDGDGSISFGLDSAEIEMEMVGMKQAIYGGSVAGADDKEDEGTHEEEVEKLQAMMIKMQAVRDMGADMPPAERKRLAAKTVNEIMKTL